jgi:acyl-coenzyme A synthetase/AMP-(fatty) acid ligase
VAYIVLTEGATLTEAEIRTRSGALLESFMVPQRVVFRAELPKTESGKINKRALRSVPPKVTLSPILTRGQIGPVSQTSLRY